MKSPVALPDVILNLQLSRIWLPLVVTFLFPHHLPGLKQHFLVLSLAVEAHHQTVNVFELLLVFSLQLNVKAER